MLNFSLPAGAKRWPTSVRRSLLAGLLCLSVLGLTDCTKKEELVAPAPAAGKLLQDAIPTPPLDWEHIDYMPTCPNGATRILVPWASGASRQFSIDIANDYKKINGWELVYNTFSTDCNPPERYFFVLYNKYRGLVRLYYYLPNTTNLTASDNMIHTLDIEGSYAASSPIMNFSAQSIVDLNTNSKFATTVERWQVAPATWYAFQYELAYDKNAAAQNYSNFQFAWPIKSVHVTQVSVAGTVTGSITGSISVPGVNLSVTGGSKTVNANGDGLMIVNGNSDADSFLASLGKAGVDGIKGAITSGVSGLVTNVFSAIFGSDSNQPNTNLKLDAQVKLDGTLTDNTLVTATGLAVPGYSQATTTGFVPAYNLPLGVFYLKSGLTFHSEVKYSGDGNTVPTPYYTYSCDFGENNDRVLINPEVLKIANITNYSQELVAISNDPSNGRTEVVGNVTYYTGTSLEGYNRPGIVGLRISFDVVPKDGSPKYRLSKTFTTTMSSETTTTLPPGQDPV